MDSCTSSLMGQLKQALRMPWFSKMTLWKLSANSPSLTQKLLLDRVNEMGRVLPPERAWPSPLRTPGNKNFVTLGKNVCFRAKGKVNNELKDDTKIYKVALTYILWAVLIKSTHCTVRLWRTSDLSKITHRVRDGCLDRNHMQKE